MIPNTAAPFTTGPRSNRQASRCRRMPNWTENCETFSGAESISRHIKRGLEGRVFSLAPLYIALYRGWMAVHHASGPSTREVMRAIMCQSLDATRLGRICVGVPAVGCGKRTDQARTRHARPSSRRPVAMSCARRQYCVACRIPVACLLASAVCRATCLLTVQRATRRCYSQRRGTIVRAPVRRQRRTSDLTAWGTNVTRRPCSSLPPH